MDQFTFFWSIENYSYFWRQNGFNMKSPVFLASVLEDTAWTVSLYPNGRDYVSVYFCRKEDDEGPENIRLQFEISILGVDLSTLWSKNGVRDFKMGAELDWVINMYKVLFQQNIESLAHHTLIVQGKVWRVEGSTPWIERSYARSRIGVEKISFDQEVEVFSNLVANEKRTTKIQSRSKKGLTISSSVHYCSCSYEQIVAEISLSDKNQFFTECKLYVLDASKNVIEHTKGDVTFNMEKNKIMKLNLSLTRKEVMDRKDEFLLYGDLHFLWECTFTTGLEFQKTEETVSQMNSLSIKHIGNNDILKKFGNVQQQCPETQENSK